MNNSSHSSTSSKSPIRIRIEERKKEIDEARLRVQRSYENLDYILNVENNKS